MNKIILTILCLIMIYRSEAQTLVKLETKYGNCIIKLYDQTPLHRDNFIKLVKSKYFDTITFNRIIKGFVIQGGDTDSMYANKATLNSRQKWIQPEFNDSLFHKRGAIAMGRDDNPEQSSFTTQFYIVEGKKWTDAELDNVEKKAWKNYHIPQAQRLVYKTIGGTPFLDQHYTVFGEIIEGIDLIDKLSILRTAADDMPFEPVEMKLSLIN